MTDQELIRELEAQKGLLVSVATDGARINDVNDRYVQRRAEIAEPLREKGLDDPSPFDDLWEWHGRWQGDDLKHWQQRRVFVANLYKAVLAALRGSPASVPSIEPTGWTKVDRALAKAAKQLETARAEEEFQTVGLLCREVMISLAQALYDPASQPTVGDNDPSATDAHGMLSAYLSKALAGKSHETQRAHVKTALKLAVELQHLRSADYKDAALALEATVSIVSMLAIVSERREGGTARTIRPPSPAQHTNRFSFAKDSVSDRVQRVFRLQRPLARILDRFDPTLHTPAMAGIPLSQGDFSIQLVVRDDEIECWYLALLSGFALEEDMQRKLADIRVLLGEHSKIPGNPPCTFIIASGHDLPALKLAAYEAFEKMKRMVGVSDGDRFRLEIWDEVRLKEKERDLGLRFDLG